MGEGVGGVSNLMGVGEGVGGGVGEGVGAGVGEGVGEGVQELEMHPQHPLKSGGNTQMAGCALIRES